jgi:hypothetical protein
MISDQIPALDRYTTFPSSNNCLASQSCAAATKAIGVEWSEVNPNGHDGRSISVQAMGGASVQAGIGYAWRSSFFSIFVFSYGS